MSRVLSFTVQRTQLRLLSFCTRFCLQIDRASAGHCKLTSAEKQEETEEPDDFGYTQSKSPVILLMFWSSPLSLSLLLPFFLPFRRFLIFEDGPSVRESNRTDAALAPC